MVNSEAIVPLVSFPKSGNTWMRFLLANVFKRDDEAVIDFKTVNDYMPTSHTEDLQTVHSLMMDGSPVFIKEHYNYFDMPYKDFKKAIYIYRNGFDALYSYWHFTDAQSPGLYQNIEAFSRCYWRYCGHWGEHLYSWMLAPEIKDGHEVLALSYEMLISEPLWALKEVVAFLGVDVPEEKLVKAIEASDKKNMKKLSGSGEFMKAKKKDFHFVRSGKKGDAEKHLPEKCKSKFLQNRRNFELLVQYGYLTGEQADDTKCLEDTPFLDRWLCKWAVLKYRIKGKWR